MSNNQPERAQGGAYPADYEREGLPAEPGRPPRPPGERQGAEGSSDTRKTLTDPATGVPHEGVGPEPPESGAG
jgi:hypothetical protein